MIRGQTQTAGQGGGDHLSPGQVPEVSRVVVGHHAARPRGGEFGDPISVGPRLREDRHVVAVERGDVGGTGAAPCQTGVEEAADDGVRAQQIAGGIECGVDVLQLHQQDAVLAAVQLAGDE